MANIDRAYEVDILSIDNNVLLASGSIDPTVTTGFEAPLGSLFLRTNGSVYKKFDTADVDWVEVSSGSSSIFGSEFQSAESLGVTTSTLIIFINKVTLNTTSLPAGTYRIEVSYGWNHDDTGTDFEARLQEDATNIGEIHKQQPKDNSGTFSTTGTSQRYYATRTWYRVLAAGTKTYTLDFRTNDVGKASSIWDASISLWRVA